MLQLTGKILGKGHFGVVCVGVYQGQPVAVKVMQKSDPKVHDEDDFINEAKVRYSYYHFLNAKTIILKLSC